MPGESMPSLDKSPPTTRIIAGIIVFILGFLSPLLIPFVLSTALSSGLKTIISGLLAFGIPELFMIFAAGIMGKPGFDYLKGKLKNILKKYGPPDTVTKTRYNIGLALFTLPILIGFLLPYVGSHLLFLEENQMLITIVLDVMLVISLFVLGGDFWDKLRSLFIYKSKAYLVDDNQNPII